MSKYPVWKYHPEKEAVIVHSEKQEKELGKGWVFSPADFGKKEPKAIEENEPSAADEIIKKARSKKASE